ncbi:MAG: hypothetical protein AB1489_41945, partial [Acidobacteriota bacterium]
MRERRRNRFTSFRINYLLVIVLLFTVTSALLPVLAKTAQRVEEYPAPVLNLAELQQMVDGYFQIPTIDLATQEISLAHYRLGMIAISEP